MFFFNRKYYRCSIGDLMRKLLISTLSILLITASTMCAASYPYDLEDYYKYYVVNFLDFEKEDLEEFFSGKNPFLVLECSENDYFPLAIELEGRFFNPVEFPPTCLTVRKRCFIRFADNNFLFSDDLSDWKVFQEFFTGMISITVNEDFPKVTLRMELDQK